jgi:serine/threonine-protein kinase
MGEVFRARDTKLGRDVALKTLPASFASDPERLARFEREAKTLASLNHSHIAQIYGFEQSGEMAALVMELVEGDDLSVRIARGPLSLDDALAIARQIADALEAAHEQGIIHRDLKPANIKVRADGVVKVLDFGLAKALEPGSGLGDSGSPNVANSPTITSPAMTMRGMILGTAAYMSPEQAKGKPVDKRTDIWAFGCVLYEMLAGRRAFEGEDVSDTLAAILRGEPDWTRLPSLPPAVLTLIRRCLERDWRRRIASMSTVRFVLEDPEVLSPASAAAAQMATGEVQARVETAVAQARRHLLVGRVIPLAALAAIAVVAAVVGFTGKGPPPSTVAVTRFLLTPADGRALRDVVRLLALSPTGNELVYLDEDRVLIRRFSEFEMRALAATDLGRSIQSPAYSPDGEWIAYYSGTERAVKRISVRGGAALRVCDVPPLLRLSSLDWNPSGIVAATGTGGAIRCNPAGGAPEQLVTVEDRETVLGAQLLPGGETLLLTIANLDASRGGALWEQTRIVVQTLRTGARKTVRTGGSDARFLSTGHLIYSVGGIVFAAPFDVGAAELRGEAVPVVEGVRRSRSGVLLLAVSDSGVLAYQPGPAGADRGLRGLAIGDRSGTIKNLAVAEASYTHVRVSRDGTRAAIGVDDGKQASVLIYPLSGASAAQRLPLAGNSRYPLWSPDARWIVFQSDAGGDLGIFRQRADGTGVAERLTTAVGGEEHVPESWSPDGKYLSFSVRKSAAGKSEYVLWMLTLSNRNAVAFDAVVSVEPIGSVFSPDGKWLAYSKGTVATLSDANRGVFVQPFPATGAIYQAPRQLVDFHPAWTASGAELVYTAAAAVGGMVAVPVTHEGGVTFGPPVLFPASVSGNRVSPEPRAWDILPDGRLIGLVAEGDDEARSTSSEIRLAVNWFEELKQRVPVP